MPGAAGDGTSRQGCGPGHGKRGEAVWKSHCVLETGAATAQLPSPWVASVSTATPEGRPTHPCPAGPQRPTDSSPPSPGTDREAAPGVRSGPWPLFCFGSSCGLPGLPVPQAGYLQLGALPPQASGMQLDFHTASLCLPCHVPTAPSGSGCPLHCHQGRTGPSLAVPGLLVATEAAVMQTWPRARCKSP